MEQQKLNIVLMNITADQGISGVNRYMETIRQGFAGREDIVVHTVLLQEKSDFFFHQIDSSEESINAIIPLPVNISPIIKEIYWLEKYSTIVADLLTPFFGGKTNLIWHTHCINLCALAMIMKERLGGRILTHLHCIPWKFCFEYDPVKFNTLYKQELNGEYTEFRKNPLEKMVYETSDKIVCVTDSTADYLTRIMGVSAKKIAVVYNGLEDFRGSFADNSGDTIPGILYVGRISREKGIIALLNALRKVGQAGSHRPVYLAGAGKASLIKEIREHYTDLDLHFLGRIPFDELKKRYAACMLGVIPSFHEQCSYVAIEMAMFGIPLIVSDVDGLKEMFTDETDALKIPLVFDPDFGLEINEDNMVEAILRLLNDDKLRKKLSRDIRARYLERFTAGRMTEESLEIYKNLINSDTLCRK